MLPVLRPYQQDDLEQARILLREHRSVLLVQPTGAGKGTLAAYITRSANVRGKRVVFLVNRRNLVHDMSKRIGKLGLEHGVIMGGDPRRRPHLSIHVASIDTIHRRENRPPADLLIVDEAHFAVTPTWAKVLASYPDAKILGMTATPIRLDGRGLGEVFEAMVLGPSVRRLIEQQYLVPAVVFRPGGPDLSGVRKTGGDFNQKQLAAVCDKPKLVGDVVEQWKKNAGGSKTAAFCVNQHHAQEVAEKFRCAGFDWAYVDCDTPDRERDRIWDDFDHGQLPGVASVGTISYGWDHPICSCIIAARPTASMGLWRQMLGRGSRPHPGKQNFKVLDHFDNTGRLDAFFEDDVAWSLAGQAVREAGTSSVSITTCRQCFATFRSGPLTCPYCLVTLPKPTRPIEEVCGELEQAERERKASAIETWKERQDEHQRRRKFNEFRHIARERGYKSNWPMCRFKAIFGHWPPREWSHGA